jgi:transcriptional regulator with XRE-family HTH domain
LGIVNIGHRLKKLREERNMTTRELADALGVKQPFISRIENCHKNGYIPEHGTLNKFAEFFHVPVTFFTEDRDVESLHFLSKVADQELKEFMAKEENVGYIVKAKQFKELNLSEDDIDLMLNLIKQVKQIKDDK